LRAAAVTEKRIAEISKSLTAFGPVGRHFAKLVAELLDVMQRSSRMPADMGQKIGAGSGSAATRLRT
jgi:hypothetical protein